MNRRGGGERAREGEIESEAGRVGGGAREGVRFQRHEEPRCKSTLNRFLFGFYIVCRTD